MSVSKYCHNCKFWEWDENIKTADNYTIFPGHCGLWSGACVNKVDSGDRPPDFQRIELNEEDIASILMAVTTNS